MSEHVDSFVPQNAEHVNASIYSTRKGATARRQMQRRHFRAAFVKLSACCNAVAYLAYVRGLNTGADKADRQFTPQNIRFAGTPILPHAKSLRIFRGDPGN